MSEQKAKDYRVTVKVRNNRLLRAIEAAGGAPGQKWCEANGLAYSSVNDLLNMTASPLLRSGGLTSTADRLCDVLGKLPDELWSNEQLYPLERNFSEMEMDHAQVVALLPRDQQSYLPDFSELEHEQVKKVLDGVVSTLSPREQDVLRMLFEDELTTYECGALMDITGERVRQIEQKALRKLRSPERAGPLSDLMELGLGASNE